ncbi:putative reverse transcriptase zinc-binding domain-containing protein [Medicago truncatula]|uniref:Putative reverse transcriptase zinc-binding domain-containing protein n=1 Tax=Medicago truncatula TaxID=3880 RepID=A0A396HVM2_MEDTR|nr:putative reverse transcriptase zinc-binding domain-containing protein [Medicago truncatula]
MKAMVDNQLFTGYSVGVANPVVVSHLQFADDTLLLGHKSWANVRALRATLAIFELMSGLKVNFNKSLLMGINISDSWLSEAASVLSCKVGKIPFLYLGLPIGGNPRRLSFWDPVVNRIKSRLSGWNSRFLSFGGRLILLKAVLTSLPVYALSFFKAPTDRWLWLPDPVGGYTVRGAYVILIEGAHPLLTEAMDLVWHRQVPLKVSIFAWRLLRDRLPSKANLAARGVLSSEATLCVMGCGHVETAEHLFLFCPNTVLLWQQVRNWLGSMGADPNNLHDHLVQFTYSTGVGKAKRSFLQLIWILCTWIVWIERNNRLFGNVVTDVPRLLDKVKLLSLRWLKAKKKRVCLWYSYVVV